MMRLSRIKVEKFKKINQVELKLSNLNILVGANGSGKSSMLQAIHLAACLMRQVPSLRINDTSTVTVNELDYLPSDHYSELGHNALWGNQKGTPSSKVSFSFEGESGITANAYSEFRSARNAGISVTGAIPDGLGPFFRGAGKFFSAYIPGISGIPNQEQKQSKRVVLKACSFGDSNVYLRNALKLLSQVEIEKIQNWLRPLVGEIVLTISHNEEKDLLIDARARLGGKDCRLELLGAGYLQLIQIFCYVLLFKPKILLVDEPDIHLHPNVQEKLPLILERISEEQKVTILLSTHSPFIVRGAPVGTNIYWMDNGILKDSNRDEIEIAMGWGAFGKKIIIVSEDQNNGLLKKIVEQWPNLYQQVAFFPGRGYKSLLTKEQALELYKTLGEKYHLLIHRDRDSMTDAEVLDLKSKYNHDGISLWITDMSDIEAYFCDKSIISQVIGCDDLAAESYIEDILSQKFNDIKNKFSKQRADINKNLYSSGGSPTNDYVWNALQSKPLKGAVGKYILAQLKDRTPNNQFSEINILKQEFATELAPSLREEIERILNSDV